MLWRLKQLLSRHALLLEDTVPSCLVPQPDLLDGDRGLENSLPSSKNVLAVVRQPRKDISPTQIYLSFVLAKGPLDQHCRSTQPGRCK